jgi:hypothetical protein
MFVSQVPMWATFLSTHACNVGSCRRTWHATTMCTRPDLCQYCAHTITIGWGLMFCCRSDSAYELVQHFGQVGASSWGYPWLLHSHTSANQKSICRDKGCSAYELYIMTCHLSWYAKYKGQKCSQKLCPQLYGAACCTHILYSLLFYRVLTDQ